MSGCGSKRDGVFSNQVADVQLGQCDPVYGCPPPTEVVCIVVEKVYDECKYSEVNEDEFVYYASPDNPVIDVECKKVELVGEPYCEVVKPGRVRATFTYRIKTKIFFEDNTSTTLSQDVTVMKNLNIPRAGEEGLNVQCYVPFLECLTCFIRDEELVEGQIRTTIICCVGKFLLIKLKATVQLAIPAYGFCPEPPDCDEVLGECPDFIPPWPPFPPQDR
jgi:hypothetical protein